jgi:hypothetical protein
MFGIKFIKPEPTTYLLQYKRGSIKREGAGMAFFYYAPSRLTSATTDKKHRNVSRRRGRRNRGRRELCGGRVP